MIRRVQRPLTTVDRRARMLSTSMAGAVRLAILSQARGGDDSAWRDAMLVFARAYVVAYLLGAANERRGMVMRGLLPPIEPGAPLEMPPQPVVFSQAAAFVLPYRDAVNVFRRDVPNLSGTAAMGAARATNSAIGALARLRGLADRIIRATVERVTEAEDFTSPAPDVVAREIAETLGPDAVATRLEPELRTAMSEAFNGGARETIRQNADVVPVTMLSEIHDRRTRGNPRGLYPEPHRHWQMDGFAAPSDDPIWDRITPPNGWNCRAGIRSMSVAECRRRGWILPGGGLDRDALRKQFASQWRLIRAGRYPDPDFKS